MNQNKKLRKKRIHLFFFFFKHKAWTLVNFCRPSGWASLGAGSKDCYREHGSLMISANLSLLKIGPRLRVKWVDLEFASTVTTVFS